MNEIRWADATELARLVRSGEVTAAELLERAVADMEASSELNAVIHRLESRARRSVVEGLPDGPFTGVPMVLKDLGQELAGAPLYEGMGFLRSVGHKADRTSELTARFERAGFVIVGKTNTPELGGVPTTEPLAFGPTRNPWDTTRTPGGSSGGSAAAVAAGIVPVGHGNDAGGSIRNPASRCGLVGLKPSRGRMPLGPGLGDMFGGLVTEFAVTRTVRDTAGLLDAVGGPAPGDPYHPPPSADSYRFLAAEGAVRGLRIGVWTGVPGGRNELTDDAVAAVETTAGVLEELGHTITPAHPDVLDRPEAGRVLGNLVMTGIGWAIRRWERKVGRPVGRSELEPITRAYLDRGAAVTGADVFDLLERSQLLTRTIDDWHDDHDLLLMGIVAEAPDRLGRLQTDDEAGVDEVLARLMPSLWLGSWVNLTGQPAIAVPTYWTADGLPLGVQLVARYGREDLLVDVAAQLERARPWEHRRPPASVDRFLTGERNQSSAHR